MGDKSLMQGTSFTLRDLQLQFELISLEDAAEDGQLDEGEVSRERICKVFDMMTDEELDSPTPESVGPCSTASPAVSIPLPIRFAENTALDSTRRPYRKKGFKIWLANRGSKSMMSSPSLNNA